jgi:hypothetical protein
VALSWLWLIAVGLAGVYFVYSATVEERNMTKAVPRDLPGVSALDEDARTLRLLGGPVRDVLLCAKSSQRVPARNPAAG